MKISSILKAIDKKQLQEDEGGAAVDSAPSEVQNTDGPVNSTSSTGLHDMTLRPLYSPFMGPFMGPFIPNLHPVFGNPVYSTVYSQMGEAIRKYRKKKKSHKSKR